MQVGPRSSNRVTAGCLGEHSTFFAGGGIENAISDAAGSEYV
jgi:hypothetical protein